MILAIDIGNSTIGCGVFDLGELRARWQFTTDSIKTVPEYESMLAGQLQSSGLEPNQIRGVAICSVVPRVTPVIQQEARNLFHTSPFLVTTDMDAGLVLRYTNPEELGVDRFVAAAAAYAACRSGVIVLDLGTATTFSVVDEHGAYLGGAIAPGIGISAAALADKTAQLPRIALLPPHASIGRDTVSGMQSGVVFGHAAMVDGMIDRIWRELGRSVRVVGTGGYASLIAPLSGRIGEVRPHLTLEGLVWLYHRLSVREK